MLDCGHWTRSLCLSNVNRKSKSQLGEKARSHRQAFLQESGCLLRSKSYDFGALLLGYES